MKAMKKWFVEWLTLSRPIRWWEAVILVGAMIVLMVDAGRRDNAEKARKQRSRDACVAECAPLRYVTDIWDGEEHVGICINDRSKDIFAAPYFAVRCAP